MRADISHSGGAEESVADRVAEDVAVGVADRAFFEGDIHAANHELALFGKTMKIVTDAGAGRARVFGALVNFARLFEMLLRQAGFLELLAQPRVNGKRGSEQMGRCDSDGLHLLRHHGSGGESALRLGVEG